MHQADFDRIGRAAGRYCACPHLRDDVQQLAALRVLRVARREGRPVGTYSDRYLFRVARTVQLDEARRAASRPADRLDDAPCPDADTPESRVAGRELGAAIASCLRRLLPDRRAAVELHLVGHNVPHVADALGTDRKRAENLVYRGLADLRRALTDAGLGRPCPAG